MKLSLAQKFLLVMVPLIGMALFVGVLTWSSLGGSQDELRHANRSLSLALQSQIYVAQMSSAMKGYLLNPADQSEFEAKGAADEKNAAVLEELVGMIDSPDVKALGEAINVLDETKLNVAENEVMELVRQGQIAEAQKQYLEKYLPLRAQYDEMAQKLTHEVNRIADAKIADVENSKKRAAWMIISGLCAGILLTSAWLLVTTLYLRRGLNQVVTSIGSNADALAAQSHQILKGSEEMNSNSSRQSSALQQTAASIEEISSMVKTTSDNAGESQHAVSRCSEKATQGQSALEDMLGAMARIRGTTQRIQAQVDAGNEQVGQVVNMMAEIEAKTRVINDIVFKTNILSFNASVEAARAGEHGKGFAVVAEEIGNLARISGTAADEIARMLQTNVERVKGIVERNRTDVAREVDEGIVVVGQGEEVAKTCARLFEDLVNEVRNVDGMLGQIATAAREQSNGVSEVSRAIGEIELVARATSQTTDEFTRSSKLVTTESESLVEVVRQLTSIVSGRAA